MRFSAVLVYPCTNVRNWLLIPQLPEGGTVKYIGVRCRNGGLQPQEMAPQGRLVWMEDDNTGFIKVEPTIAQTKYVTGGSNVVEQA